MKKILLLFFSAFSFYIVIMCFVAKANNKEPYSVNVILKEMSDCDIGYDIRNDITELSSSLSDLNDGVSYDDNPLTAIVNVGRTIYYVARFALKLIVHTLVACINIIIFACRVLGVENMNYLRFTSESGAIGGRIVF